LLTVSSTTTKEPAEQPQEKKSTRGAQIAENIRFGQRISESGFGGETTGNSGDAQKGGYGRVRKDEEVAESNQSRTEAGYGGGFGVGG
jgi:hypothetical protein